MIRARSKSQLLAATLVSSLALGIGLWLLTTDREAREETPLPVVAAVETPDASAPDEADELAECAPGLWAVPALDAVWAVESVSGGPLVWEVSALEASLTSSTAATLSTRVEAAATADFFGLGSAARVAAQNDLWGLLQRLRATSAGGALELEKALETLILRLAPDGPSLAGLAGHDVPLHVRRVLPLSEAWKEMDTEHAVLGHERAFGLRRLFRLFSRGEDGHALVSQLIALDAMGNPHLTKVAGEIEQLRMQGGRAAEAHVWELDRRALRCRGVDASLHEAERITHIPGLGASSFLLELEVPETVASLPCLRCHDDPDPFSLPIEPRGQSLAERRAKLLSQVSLQPSN